MGRSHVALAVCGYVALSVHPLSILGVEIAMPRIAVGATFPALDILFGAVVVAACSLVPDIDTASSKAARSLGVSSRMMAFVIGVVFEHRGLTHSLLGFLVAAYVGFQIGLWLGVPEFGHVVMVGYGSHVALDALTERGVKLLWPIPIWIRVAPPGLMTGGRMERWVVCPAGILACTWWASGPVLTALGHAAAG